MNKDRFGRTPEERQQAMLAIERANADARVNWGDTQWRKMMAQELTETIYMGFQHENLLSLIAEVENLPFDGRAFVKEVRGLRAFWIARGGYIEASEMNAEVMEIPRDSVGFHVWDFEEKLRTNFAETQATMIDRSIERLDSTINQAVLALFQEAVGVGDANYSSASGLSLTTLNTALASVRDASRQREVTIIGRATMTDQIMDQLVTSNSYPAFLPETNEELLRTGVLGTYRGAKIVTLVNYLDDQDQPFFPGDEMWVVARDASKFAFWGDLDHKEFVEQDNWYWHYIAKRDFGGVVHRPDRLHRIVDSSL